MFSAPKQFDDICLNQGAVCAISLQRDDKPSQIGLTEGAQKVSADALIAKLAEQMPYPDGAQHLSAERRKLPHESFNKTHAHTAPDATPSAHAPKHDHNKPSTGGNVRNSHFANRSMSLG